MFREATSNRFLRGTESIFFRQSYSGSRIGNVRLVGMRRPAGEDGPQQLRDQEHANLMRILDATFQWATKNRLRMVIVGGNG